MRDKTEPPEGAALSASRGTCSIEGCGEPLRSRGWCNAHRLRWQRHGDPLGGGRMRCKWVSRDEDGRPSCIHGPADKDGRSSWRCGEKKRESCRRWRQDNPEKCREYSHERRKNNPGLSTKYGRNRRNRIDQAKIDALLATNPWLKEALGV